MFRGNHPARVDEKGRLKVPAEFKRIFDEQYGPAFFITSFDGVQAEIFPMKEWEKIEADVEKLSGTAKKRFLCVANTNGQVVEMDGQGRLLLPQHLREKAGLIGDLAVIGLQNHVAVVNEEKHNQRMEEDPLTDSDFEALGIPGL
jgi:MraZ protein